MSTRIHLYMHFFKRNPLKKTNLRLEDTCMRRKVPILTSVITVVYLKNSHNSYKIIMANCINNIVWKN